jgi:RNA polymerase sigma-70 factor (ECF subfamily)
MRTILKNTLEKAVRAQDQRESDPSSGVFSLQRYRAYLHSLVRARLEPRLWAKVDPSEVVQEALLKAFQARDQFRGRTEQQLAAWLRTILNNTLLNALRDCGRRIGYASISLNEILDSSFGPAVKPPADPELPPDELAAHNERLVGLAEALGRLPEDQRTVLEMKHLQGLSVAEISERTDRTKPSVVGLLYRGTKALRLLLGNPNDAAASDGP